MFYLGVPLSSFATMCVFGPVITVYLLMPVWEYGY